MKLSARNTEIWCVALSFAMVSMGGRVGAQEATLDGAPDRGDREDVLVLQDGGVLVGRVTRAGDRYVLARSGSEMQIPASGVMLVCGSLDEAYEQRRDQLTTPTAEAHLTLASWCLRHNLTSQAARELAEARRLDEQSVRLGLLERRLANAREQAENSRAAVSRVEPSPPVSRQPSAPAFSAEDLPSGVVERFTRKVQPVLVNNCTDGGCHQPGGSEPFQLDRALLHGLANQRSTMRNLAATLALVDRERPARSPLLTLPRRTHGDMAEPIFGPRHEQAFHHLVEWVELVAQDSSTEKGSSTGDAFASAIEANARRGPQQRPPVMVVPQRNEPVPGDPYDVEAASAEMAPTGGDTKQAFYAERAAASLRRPRFGAQLQPWRPKDPFDPEIFNRRYSERSGQADPEATDDRLEGR